MAVRRHVDSLPLCEPDISNVVALCTVEKTSHKRIMITATKYDQKLYMHYCTMILVRLKIFLLFELWG